MWNVDATAWLATLLRGSGWNKISIGRSRSIKGRGPDGLEGMVQQETWGRRGAAVVLVGPFSYSGDGPRRTLSGPVVAPNPRAIQQAFEETLQTLVKYLDKRLMATLAGPFDLVFPGGGTLTLPDWFLRDMKRLGIGVYALGPSGEVEPYQPRGDVHGPPGSAWFD